jgi:hypothetical protein
VLVCKFQFDANPTRFRLDRTQLRLIQSQPDIILSRPATTSFAGNYKVPQIATIAITMAISKTVISLIANLQPESPNLAREISKRYPDIAIDIRAISSAILLGMHDIVVKPNGSQYQSGGGLWSQRISRKLAEKALAEGVLCVLFMRDEVGLCSDARSTRVTADSLNLDRVRWN